MKERRRRDGCGGNDAALRSCFRSDHRLQLAVTTNVRGVKKPDGHDLHLNAAGIDLGTATGLRRHIFCHETALLGVCRME